MTLDNWGSICLDMAASCTVTLSCQYQRRIPPMLMNVWTSPNHIRLHYCVWHRKPSVHWHGVWHSTWNTVLPQSVRWRWRRLRSPPLSSPITSCQRTMRRCFTMPHYAKFLKLPNRSELTRWCPSRMTLKYCALLHLRRCWRAEQTQEKYFKGCKLSFYGNSAWTNIGHRQNRPRRREDVDFLDHRSDPAGSLIYLPNLEDTNNRLFYSVQRQLSRRRLKPLTNALDSWLPCCKEKTGCWVRK